MRARISRGAWPAAWGLTVAPHGLNTVRHRETRNCQLKLAHYKALVESKESIMEAIEIYEKVLEIYLGPCCHEVQPDLCVSRWRRCRWKVTCSNGA
jgi:hypothetical protein